MKRITILLVAILAVLPMVKGQVKLALDSTSIMIGSQTTLTISGLDTFPSQQILTQNDIVVLNQWFDTMGGTIRQHTILTSFEEGEHTLKVSANDSIILIVNDVSDLDTANYQIRDIAPIMKEPLTFWEIFRWVLLALGLAGAVWAIVYAVKRLKNKEKPTYEPKPTPIAAHKQALEQLEHLRNKQLWQQGKLKEYHTELTDILRAYFEYRYGFNSTEMTSDQTIETFQKHGGTIEDTQLLREVLQTADMVKFAKSEPLPYEHDRSMSDTKQLILNTAPKENPTTDNNEKQ